MKKVKDARFQVLKLAMKHTMRALHNAESEKEKAELNKVVDFILDEQEQYVRKADTSIKSKIQLLGSQIEAVEMKLNEIQSYRDKGVSDFINNILKAEESTLNEEVENLKMELSTLSKNINKHC